jgi:hypothetical protein
MEDLRVQTRKLSGYYMHVELLVLASDAEKFEDKLAVFMDGRTRPFQRLDVHADYELVLALKTVESFPFAASGHGRFGSDERRRLASASGAAESSCRDSRLGEPVFRYVHLWTVPDRDDLDLANVMIRSADDTPYMELDALVASESQEFVRRVQRPSAPVSAIGQKWVRIVRRFQSKNLGAYLFRSGVLLPVMQQAGWHSHGQYQNVTGPLNTVTEFWTSEDPRANALQMYQQHAGPNDELRRRLVEDVSEKLPVSDLRETFVVPGYFQRLRRSAA